MKKRAVVVKNGRRRRKGLAKASDTVVEKTPASFNALRVSLYTTLQDPVKHVRLRDISTGIISGAAPSVSKRWNPNSAYAPIAGGSASATPGFAEWAALYDRYRVMGYKAHVTFTQITAATPTNVYLLNLTSDPGTAAALAYGSNRYCYTKLLSAAGGMDRCVFMQPLLTISQLVGSNQPRVDDSFAAPVTASPSNLVWLTLGATTASGGNLTTGVAYAVDLEIFVDFYEPARNA